WSSLVPIRPSGSKPPLFCVHAAGANVLIYRPLARHLSPDQPVYALQAQGLDGIKLPYTNVEEMATHYIKEILTVQPNGPYFLLGASFGGLVVYEMAQQLIAMGEKVALLVLFDTYFPILTHYQRLRSHLDNLSQNGVKNYFKELMRALNNRINRKVKKIFR